MAELLTGSTNFRFCQVRVVSRRQSEDSRAFDTEEIIDDRVASREFFVSLTIIHRIPRDRIEREEKGFSFSSIGRKEETESSAALHLAGT